MRVHISSVRIMIDKSPGLAISNGRTKTPTRSMFKVSVLFLFVCLSGLWGGAYAQCTPCPTVCTCTHVSGTTDDCSVDCSNNSFNFIPSPSELPTANDILYLDMSYNQIENVHQTDFEDMTKLRTIDLQENMIEYMSGLTFKYNTEIEIANLAVNEITELGRDLFSTTKLTSLNISHLKLSKLESNVMSKLVTLTTLDVSYNKISSLSTDLFDQNQNLEYLNICHNQLTSLPQDVFNDLDGLTTLDLGHNNLTSLPQDVFNDLEDLMTLNLDNNFLTSLQSDVFHDLTRLTSLNLSGNGLTSLSKNIFKELKRLETLYLDHNNIIGFENDTFSKTKKLTYLDLGSNSLTSLSSSIFNSLNNLQTLILSNNQLTTMDSTILTSLNHLQSVDLSGNPWDCSCSLKSFRDSLVTLESNGITLVNRDQVTCATNPSTTFLDQADDTYWFACAHKTKRSAWKKLCKSVGHGKYCNGPSSYGSCYEDEEVGQKYAVFYAASYSASDQLNCTEKCFDYNYQYAVLDGSTCLCGNIPSDHNDCLCNAKPYVAGDSMQCVSTSNLVVTKTFLLNVFKVESGLNFNAVTTVTAGTRYMFTASVVLRTITSFTWSFGDSSYTDTRSTSSMSYNIEHTYPLPGLYDLTVTIASVTGGTDSATMKVHVNPATSTVDPVLSCPSSVNYESSLSTVTVSFGMANALEYTWTRSPDDGVTSTVGGVCESSWTEFRGRCVKFQSAIENYNDAVASCGSDTTLVSIHYAAELSSIVTQYSLSATSGKILLDAKKNGQNYYWSTGNKAYFTVSSVSNAANGDCVYIDITTSTLQGQSCSATAQNICQKKPVECPYGGSAYGTTNMCYVLQSTSSSWSSASTACQALTSYASLAIVDSSGLQTHVINSVLGSTTEAWVGLSDSTLEGHLEWVNHQSLSGYPSVTAQVKDCYSLSNSGIWTAKQCSTTLPYLCQYSVIRAQATVTTALAGTGKLSGAYNLTTLFSTSKPSNAINLLTLFPGSATGHPHLYGTGVLSSTAYTLVSLAASNTASTISSNPNVTIFPGLWINKQGKLRAWNFKTNTITSPVTLVLQVYEPVCSGSDQFIVPGCDGNGARFGSCVSSGSCSAGTSCGNTEEYCYISKTCQPKVDACNCDVSVNSFCSSLYKGSSPTYYLRGQTYVSLAAGGPEYYTVSTDNYDVQPNYILAFQTDSGSDIIQCDTNTGSTWEQSAIQAVKTSWMSIGDSVSAGSLWKNNTACYFQAIVAGSETEALPSSQQFFTKPDTYTYTVSAPSLSIAKTCDIKAEEQIGSIVWITPVIQSTTGSVDTLYVEHNVPTYLVFSITRGSHLTPYWKFGSMTSSSTFVSSCPSDVESTYSAECNATNQWPSLPYAYNMKTFDYNAGSTESLTITVTNDVSPALTKTFTIVIFLPIEGLSIDLTVSNVDNIVEKGVSTQFTVTATSGNPNNYLYSVNGSVISTGALPTFSHLFSSKTVYVVEVEASDGLNTVKANITVEARDKAQITGLAFSNVPDYIVLNTVTTLTVTATAAVGVPINSTWMFGTSVIHNTAGVSTASLTLSTTYTFPSTGIFNLNVSIIDEFGEEVYVQKNIEILEIIPSVVLTANATLTKVNDSVAFTMTIPAALQSYGNISYTVNYADGTIEVNATSNILTHQYTSAGTYNVTVIAMNGVSSVTHFIVVNIQEMITNLVLTGSEAVLANISKTYTATYNSGTSLQFEFNAVDFGLSQGPSNSPSFSMSFTKLGTFNITVRVFNDIDSVTTFIQVYVITPDTLIIRSLTHDRYKAVNEAVTFTLDVLHHDTSSLVIIWDFGDSTTKQGTGLLTTTHTYTTANNYNVTVSAQDTTQTPNIGNETYSPITALEKITTLAITNNGPGEKNSTHSAVVTVSATVATGTQLQYKWTYDGSTIDTGYTPSISITYTTIGSKTVTLNVSNELSEDSASTTFTVYETIEELNIKCSSCVSDSYGNKYIEESISDTYTATIAAGSDVTFGFNFGDGTSNSGQTTSYTHTYSTGNYTLTVTASNAVSSQVVTLPISAQSAITSVGFPTTMATIALINSPITYRVTVTGGSDLNYLWKYCDTCTEIHSTSSSITNNAGYSSPDYYNVNVTVYNMISSETTKRQLVILKAITSATLTTDLIGGQYAEQGVSYTFSCLADSDYPIVYYYWKTKEDGGSYTLETMTQNHTHTFTSSGTYKANCRATNLFTTQNEEMTIYCQERITSPSLQPNSTGTVGTSAALHLQASTTAGSDLQYAWKVTVGGTSTALASATNELVYSFSVKGTYVFSVNVSNDVSSEETSYTQTVMEEIDGISIDTDIGATSPYLAKDTTVVFSLVLTKGESYTVQWSLKDSTASVITTGTGASFTYMFASSGTYTVDVTVTNQVSSKTAQLIIYVQVPLTSVSLAGSVNSVKTGSQVIYTVTHNTDATDLTYTWFIDGTTSQSVGTTKSYTFTSPSTYTVGVIVNNNISNFTDQVSTVVQDAITGLAITGCDTTAVEDISVPITGSISTGTDVTYTWSTSNGLTAIGSVFSALFDTTGQYTVTVNASNLVDTADLTCSMVIIGIISNVHVMQQSSSIYFTTYQVNFLVSGDNLVGVTYTWTFTGPATIVKTTTANLNAETFTLEGNYTLELNVSNRISSEVVYTEFQIKQLTCAAHSMITGGVTSKTIYRVFPSVFEIVVDTNSCDSYKLAYTWIVYQDTCAVAGTTSVSLPSTVFTTSSKFIIPGQTLAYGNYCVKAHSEFIGTPLKETVQFDLHIIASDPVAIISGGSNTIEAESHDVVVDGSHSFDPDNSSSVTHSWSCTVTPSVSPSGCDDVTGQSTDKVTMQSSKLHDGQTYTITLTASIPSRTSQTVTKQIHISADDVPQVSIECVSCSASESYILSESQLVMLRGSCSNCPSASNVTYKWTAKYGTTSLTLDSTTSSTGDDKINLVIDEGQLPYATTYSFKLVIEKSDGSGTVTGYAETEMTGNTLPSSGSCRVSPTTIVPLENQVTFNCTGYTDSSSSNTLYYRVVSYSQDSATMGHFVVLYYGSMSSGDFYVAPWPSSPGAVRNKVKIKIFVEDENGGKTEAYNQDITASTPSYSGTKVEYIWNRAESVLANLILENNPTLILQFAIALAHEINEESRSAGGAVTEMETRTKVRTAVTLATCGLPLETLHEREQMSFILEHITNYPSEFQIAELQNIALTEIDTLKSQMSSVQGSNHNAVLTSHLLACTSNLMTAANTQFYNASSITNATVNLDNALIRTYVSKISSIVTTSSSLSAQDHKVNVITGAFSKSEDVVNILLQNKIIGQDPVTIELSGIKVQASRVMADVVNTEYQTDGLAIQVQTDILNSITSPTTEVIQIIMGVTDCPFTWSFQSSIQVNTQVMSMSFRQTDGTNIAVNSLSSDKEIKFFLPDTSITGYSITNSSLIQSTGYDPTQGLTYTTLTGLAAGKRKKISIDTSDSSPGLSLHIQLRIASVDNASLPAGTVPDGEITFYLGKGYEANTETYEQKLIVKETDMAAGIDHRLYTMFLGATGASFFDRTSTYSISAYNDDDNYSYNISVGVYYTSCQYYDTATNAWSSSGCSPSEESIPTYAVCSCNHLTAFGGGMLVPPSAISFSDIVHLNFYTNPVVFITCSIIFVVYVVAVIICRKFDKIDLEKMAVIPLCGKDGSHKYEVTVITGRQTGSGTTAHIGIKLSGEYGNSKARNLAKNGAFKRNSQDSFIIAHDTNLGNIHKILIWHDNYGLDPSWYLTQVIVRDLQTDCKYYFFANCWMSLEMENGFIQKEIKAAGSSEIQKFSRMFGHAVSNAIADRHLWVSIMDRLPGSRFTRVQRATVCVTLLYTFMGINAMWYGILKTGTDVDGEATVSSFGWEEVVLALVTNLMVFPVSLVLIFLFKKSKAKSEGVHGTRPVTAQTLEIENVCDNSQYSSFRTASGDDILSCYDRESTADSFQPVTQSQPIRRTRTMKTNPKKLGEETNVKGATNMTDNDRTNLKLKRTNNPRIWNQDTILDNWPNLPVYNERMDDALPKPQRRSSVSEEKVTEAADDIMNYLDTVEKDCMEKESNAIKQQRATGAGGGAAKPLTRKHTGKLQRTGWEDVDDLLHSNVDQTKAKPRMLTRKVSTIQLASQAKTPNSSQSQKSFTPRQDANIGKPPSSAGNTVSKWVSKLRPTHSIDSLGVHGAHHAIPEVEPIGPLEPDLTLARSNTDYQSFEEEEIPFPSGSFCCTLPPWCIYIAYILCFMMSSTFIILVILYGQKFGSDIALNWLLALLFSFIFSFLFIEPVKALFIALYMATIEKKTEDTDDVIVPTFDASNERVKESMFKPLAGFALMNAKDDGQKLLRMRLMMRQFVAYLFYLWLLMALSYIYFPYYTYLLSNTVENTFIRTTLPNTQDSFQNISSINDFWTWSKTVLADGLHQEERTTIEEYNTLLGVARMRQVRGLQVSCPASEHAIHEGLSALIDDTCRGSNGYTEDTYHYGYWWNLSQSQNLSWRYYTSGQTGSKFRYGNIFSYSGGGYLQNLGATYNETLSILEDLEDMDWIDLRTRAVFVDFTVYNGAEDLTTVTSLMVEFPLTGNANTSYALQTHKMLRYIDGKVDPYMVCQVILFLVIVYYVIHLAVCMRREGCKFFSNSWNWFETLTTLLAMAAVGLYVGCVITATDVFIQFSVDRTSFTNFETVADIHNSSRHLHAWLLFFIMIKVVKQIRFIKFLHIYERVMSHAFPKLAGVLLILIILYLNHGMVAYLFYGKTLAGFANYGTTLTSLIGMLRGSFNFFPLLKDDEVFTHFFLYSYYAFTYGLTIALLRAILNDSYKVMKSRMFFKATLDLQDYEMVEFMLKRFKLWAGIDKPKPEFRKVHFEGLPSISDRCSTSQSSRSVSTDSGNSSLLQEITERNTKSAAEQLSSTWEKVLKTMAEVEFLDDQEESLMNETQKEIEEWKFQSRIKNYESERQGLLTWKQPQQQQQQQQQRKVAHRTMTQNSLPGKGDIGTSSLKPTNSAGGKKPPPSKGRRPQSDGGRIEPEQQQQKSGSKERLSIYNFFKSIKPSKDAWNK